MKYFRVENNESNYRNWYSAESPKDVQLVAKYDSGLMSVDVTECDRESIPINAVIYPASKRDVDRINNPVKSDLANIQDVVNTVMVLFYEKLQEAEKS